MKVELLEKIDLQLPEEFKVEFPNKTILADISGIDSIAAVCKVLEAHKEVKILPTIIELACEIDGDKHLKYKAAIDSLSSKFNTNNNVVLPCLLIDVNDLWKSIVANNINDKIKSYDFYSPCISCHFVFHLSRIKLVKALNIQRIVSGERELHGHKEKINQYDYVLNFYNRIYHSLGVEHLQPIRKMSDSSEINKLVKSYNLKHVQLQCLFSGNYYKSGTKEIEIKKDNIEKYIDGYLSSVLNELNENVSIRCTHLGFGGHPT